MIVKYVASAIFVSGTLLMYVAPAQAHGGVHWSVTVGTPGLSHQNA